jgi:flagellin
MPLTILNDISAQAAQNALSKTQARLQNALNQLSTGLKINSGADDPAGLSMASGLTANVAALTQSQQNAGIGIGYLQVADGALAQVTTLLNRAVTLATEAASGGLTAQQRGAADAEYQSILAEIGQIGVSTDFNGANVFSARDGSPIALTNGGVTITGSIDPEDALSGGFTVTSTFPANPGTALPVTFSASADGSTITSSVISTGEPLSGTLIVGSAGGNASATDSINIANYPGLNDPTTAAAAANLLASDLTTAIGSTTGSTYHARFNDWIVGNGEVSTYPDHRSRSRGAVAIIAEPVCQNGVLHGIVRIPMILQKWEPQIVWAKTALYGTSRRSVTI